MIAKERRWNKDDAWQRSSLFWNFATNLVKVTECVQIYQPWRFNDNWNGGVFLCQVGVFSALSGIIRNTCWSRVGGWCEEILQSKIIRAFCIPQQCFTLSEGESSNTVRPLLRSRPQVPKRSGKVNICNHGKYILSGLCYILKAVWCRQLLYRLFWHHE